MAQGIDGSKGDVQFFVNHLHTLCKNEQACTDYVLNFLADIVQHPANKSGVFILFKSDQGAGKNRFIDFFGKMILGNELYGATAKPEIDLFSKHSNIRSGKMLVTLNEIGGLHKFVDTMKDMITEDTMTLEPKGIDSFTRKSFERYIATTNNDNPLKLEGSDRRFFLVECANTYINDYEYFKNYNVKMNDPENAVAFFKFLMERDISNVNWQNRPKTQFYMDVLERTAPPLYLFMRELYRGRSDEIACYNCDTLLERYKQYLLDNSIGFGVRPTGFGIDMRNMTIERIRKGTEDRVWQYVIHWKTVKPVVEKKLGFKIDDAE